MITPAAAPGTMADAALSSTLCSPAYVTAATTEIGSTAAIVVPLAAARAIPTFRDVSTGTMTTPPATPSSPHSTPATAPPTPRTAVRLSSRQRLIRATRPVLDSSDAMSPSFRLDRTPPMWSKGSLADPGCTFLAAVTAPAGPVTREVVTAAFGSTRHPAHPGQSIELKEEHPDHRAEHPDLDGSLPARI